MKTWLSQFVDYRPRAYILVDLQMGGLVGLYKMEGLGGLYTMEVLGGQYEMEGLGGQYKDGKIRWIV